MGHLTRYLVIFSLSLGYVALCTAPNPQTFAQNKTLKKPGASVSGRVTVKGKGKAGIVVGLRLGDFAPRLAPLSKGTTDQDGNYRITNLPPGNYQIAPVAPAYVGADLNFFGQSGKSLILSEGENVDGIDFSLVPGGVITGKVSTADGRPVVEERVFVVQADQAERRVPMQPMSSSFQTDDRGVYRIFGLSSGRYKVSIGENQDSYVTTNRPGRPAYERVFYPDATNPDEAKVVEVSEGSESANIDITVGQSITGFAAAGIVMDGETNQPLANVRFGIQKIAEQRGGSFISSSVVSNRLGEFKFESLTPGKYAIFIMPVLGNEMRGDPVNFEIIDQDVSGLTLRTSRGASVSGILVLEGIADKSVQSKLAQLRIFASVRSDSPAVGFAQMGTINPDGTFRIGGLQAGQAQFQLSAQDRGLLQGFLISRVERDGVVSPRGLEIKPGEQISGVRVFVIYGTGTVQGIVKLENGTLPPEGRLFVRLQKQDQQSLGSRQVDARGRFAIEGIPAGTYDLWVNCYIPGALTRQPYTKQAVTVTEGSVTELEVVLNLDQNSSPKP